MVLVVSHRQKFQKICRKKFRDENTSPVHTYFTVHWSIRRVYFYWISESSTIVYFKYFACIRGCIQVACQSWGVISGLVVLSDRKLPININSWHEQWFVACRQSSRSIAGPSNITITWSWVHRRKTPVRETVSDEKKTTVESRLSLIRTPLIRKSA